MDFFKGFYGVHRGSRFVVRLVCLAFGFSVYRCPVGLFQPVKSLAPGLRPYLHRQKTSVMLCARHSLNETMSDIQTQISHKSLIIRVFFNVFVLQTR